MYTVIIPYKKPYTDVRYEIEASSISDARAKGLAKAFYDNGSMPHFKLRITKQRGSAMTEIPEFLLEMSRQINEQSNRSTAEPIYQVRQKEYLITQQDYNEHHFELVDDEGGVIYSSDTKSPSNSQDWLANLTDDYPEWCEIWMTQHHCFDDETDVEAFLRDHFNLDDGDDEYPEGVRKVFLQETEKVIKSCLTEADAKAFISRKSHDYNGLYIYADSMVFCPQMIELRNWIKNLTGSKG